MTGKSGAKVEVPLRIVVLEPLPGVTYALQRGRDELVPPATKTPTAESPAGLSFELTVLASGSRNEPPRLTGPFAQGPPSGRFVYVSSGTLAGQRESCWSRRAKVPLPGITWADIDEVLRGGRVLEAAVRGTGRDGGPSCGSVPLAAAWRPRPV